MGEQNRCNYALDPLWAGAKPQDVLANVALLHAKCDYQAAEFEVR